MKNTQPKVPNASDSLIKVDFDQLEQVQLDVVNAKFELKQFIELNPVPMVLFRGPEHTYSIVNRAHNKMVGKSVTGIPIRQAFSPEEALDVPDILDQIYQTGQPYISKESFYRFKGVDGKGQSLWLNQWFYPFRTKKRTRSFSLSIS